MGPDAEQHKHEEQSTPEEQTAEEAAAAGATSPQASKKDPGADLKDGETLELDAFGRPAPGGIPIFRRTERPTYAA
jgi:hypothetical protein